MELSNASSYTEKLENIESISQKNDNKNINQEKRKKEKVEILLNFKFDDYEPVDKKYKPQYRKFSNRYYNYREPLDVLDQNRFKFILNLDIDEQSYNKYLHSSSSTLKWEDIFIVISYLEKVHTCAICLEKELVCPQITRCGHIFCWPCIDNYYNYWTVTAINKKNPKCPLCMDLINPDELKICEIIKSVSYLDSESSINYNESITDTITLNLIMKEKKGKVLYNINCDPDLSYFKENYLSHNYEISDNEAWNRNASISNKTSNKNNFVSKFNFIPSEDSEKFFYSMIFTTTKELIVKRLKIMLRELERNLKEELDVDQDERRVISLTKCIDILRLDIDYYEGKTPVSPEDTNKAKDKKKASKTTEEILKKNLSDGKNNLEAKNTLNTGIKQTEEKIRINNQLLENLSTVDEDSSQNKDKNYFNQDFDRQVSIDLKNYFFFYQESNADIYILHPINYQILLAEYELEDHLPSQITGKILEIEPHQVTSGLKNKYQFLSYLRFESLIYFVEIDMRHLVSNYTLKKFQNVLKERSKIRNSIKREEENYENYVQKIKDIEEMNLTQSYKKFNSFKQNIKGLNELSRQNSDNESISSTNRKESEVKYEEDLQASNQVEFKNENQNPNKEGLKALFSGALEEEQRKIELESQKKNKKKINIDSLPSLENIITNSFNPLKSLNNPQVDIINNSPQEEINSPTRENKEQQIYSREDKDNKRILENKIKINLIDKNLNQVNEAAKKENLLIVHKKGKKNKDRKKFINIDVNIGANFNFYDVEPVNNMEDMLEEDILVQNLTKKSSKNTRKENPLNKLQVKKGKK